MEHMKLSRESVDDRRDDVSSVETTEQKDPIFKVKAVKVDEFPILEQGCIR